MKAKFLEAMYGNKLEFPGGLGGRRGMDNYYLELHILNSQGLEHFVYHDNKKPKLLTQRTRVASRIYVFSIWLKKNSMFWGMF